MADYKLFQDTEKGKKILAELNEKGINIVVEHNGGTSSTIKVNGADVCKGVIPCIKGFLEGMHYAVCKS